MRGSNQMRYTKNFFHFIGISQGIYALKNMEYRERFSEKIYLLQWRYILKVRNLFDGN
jgi:hypothetical protein